MYLSHLLNSLLAAILFFSGWTDAHTWPEALNLINSDGTIAAPTGYVRNYVPRNATGFKGDQTDSFQKTQNVTGAYVCMTRETSQIQSKGYPRLSVTPGAKVAIRYAENGHVTIEQAGRPLKGGPVYIFGTTNGKSNPLITDMMQWNFQGTGGNKQGKLITIQNFDDGRCYENNTSPMAEQRAKVNPVWPQLPLPDYNGLPCQKNFIVPKDAPVGTPYTIYWIWNFTMTNPPDSQPEIFSNCLDFNVQAPNGSINDNAAVPQVFDNHQPPISAAVSSYFVQLATGGDAAITSYLSATSLQYPQVSSQAGATSTPQPPQASTSQAGLTSTPQSPSSSAAVITGLVSEASGGEIQVPSPAASPTATTKTITISPTATTKTITILPPSSPTDLIKTVYVNSGPSSQGSAASATKYPSSSPAAAESSQLPFTTPAIGNSNNMHIPLLSLGSSGAGRVSPTGGSGQQSSKRSQQHHNASRFRRMFH